MERTVSEAVGSNDTQHLVMVDHMEQCCHCTVWQVRTESMEAFTEAEQKRILEVSAWPAQVRCADIMAVWLRQHVNREQANSLKAFAIYYGSHLDTQPLLMTVVPYTQLSGQMCSRHA